MHVEGFRRALTQAVNRYAKDRNLVKAKDAAFQGDDVREGLTAIVSVRLTGSAVRGSDEGQARNTEIPLARRARYEHAPHAVAGGTPESREGDRGESVERARARSAAKSARDLTRRKTALDGVGMPDKLADCASRAIATGRSCSSWKATRPVVRHAMRANPKIQAILPLRGKILNVERASMDKVVANTEIQSLTAAIGGGIGADFDVAKVRYGRVIILADADVDGGHIRTLLTRSSTGR